MVYGFLDIAITPSVRAAQAEMGSDHLWQDFRGHRTFDRFTPNEVAFIAQRDSFYMATVSETGWPYVQHRGGAAGFLKVIDEKTLAFADYRGNRQYISLGNLKADDRAALILWTMRAGRVSKFTHALRCSVSQTISPLPKRFSIRLIGRSLNDSFDFTLKLSTGTARSTSPHVSPKPRSRRRSSLCVSVS